MLNQVVSLLKYRGYQTFTVDGSIGIYVKENDDKVHMIILCAYRSNLTLNDYEKIRQAAEFNVVTRFKKKVEPLFVIVNRDGMFDDELTAIVSRLSGVWLMAGDTGKIYIYENQPTHFDGDLNEYLENNLFRMRGDYDKGTSFRVTPVNITIVVINVLVFIAVMLINRNVFASYDADVMLKMGASSYNSFISGRYYELITAMFLHFGIAHLFNNMLLLTYIGCELERRIGALAYAFVYMGSGIAGNIVSLVHYSRVGDNDIVSAGASGAIFGVIGCMALYLLINPSKDRNLTTRRLMTMALLTIYYGLTNVGVDNAAHIGGFCFGIINGFLLSKIFHYDKIKE